LAKALSPCYIRVGGTTADFLQFSPNSSYDRHRGHHPDYNHGNTINKVKFTNFTMTGTYGTCRMCLMPCF